LAQPGRAAGEVQEQFAGRSHLNACAGAVQKPNAQLVLKKLDVLADRRLADMQLFRSAAKAGLLGNGAKDLNPVVFQHRTKREA